MLSKFRFVFVRLCVLVAVLVVGVGDVCGQGVRGSHELKTNSLYYRGEVIEVIRIDGDIEKLARQKDLDDVLLSKHGLMSINDMHYQGLYLRNIELQQGRIILDGSVVQVVFLDRIYAQNPPLINGCAFDKLYIAMGTLFGKSAHNPKIFSSNYFNCDSSRIGTLGLSVLSFVYEHFPDSGHYPVTYYNFTNDSINEVSFLANIMSVLTDTLGFNVRFKNCYIKKLSFVNSFTDYIDFSGCIYNQTDTIEVITQVFSKPINANLFVDKTAIEKNCVLVFNSPLESKLLFNYKYFKMNPASIDACYQKDPDATKFMYENLIAMQEEHGYGEGKQKLDVEYKDFLLKHDWSFQLFFSKWWWGYGYDKGRIFKWTGGLFLLFFFVNLMFRDYLFDEVYGIKALEPVLGGSRAPEGDTTISVIIGILYYSALVFFGIKLDVSNFKINRSGKKLFFVGYLYTFYVIGIVCLVFIANYVLLK